MMARNTVFLKYLFVFLLLLAGVYAHAQTVDFAANTTGGCSPLSVVLTNKSTGFSSAADYIWDLGNGNISRLKDPGVTYKDPKKYTVKLTVIDAGKTYSKSIDISVYKNPQADFSLDLTKGCVPLPVTFTSKSVAGDGTIVNYFWDFGDGSLESNGSQVQEHTYYTAQATTVALTVRNSFGCLGTQAKRAALTVSPALKVEFSAKRTVLCNVADTVAFTNASSGPGKLTYTWDFGDGKVSTEKDPLHRYSTKGSYAVKLSISNSDGCTAESSGATIISVADFHTDFDLPQLICEKSAVLFIDKSSPASGSQTWAIDGVKYNASSTGLTATFNDVNAHQIQLAKNYNGCPDTTTKIIRATASPKLDGFMADLQETCNVPATVRFKDTTRSAVKWAWDFNNNRESFNPVSFVGAPSFTFDSAGIFYTLLQVTNAAGCSASAGKSIAIGQGNTHIVSSVGDYSCENSLVTFSAQSDVDIKTFAWEFSDDASTSNQSNPKHTFLKEGNYTTTLHYTTVNGCNGTTSFDISVLERPDFDFTASPGTVICGNTPVKFIVSGANTHGDYYWNFGDDTSYIYRPYNVQHRFTSDTTFTISLVIQNAGCSDTLTKKDYIKVLPPFPKVSRIINTCNGTRGLVTLQETSKKATSRTWNFGDGSAVESYDSIPTEVKHTYNATGTYRVALTVTNGGCTVSDTVNVPVLLKQNPLLSSSETEICRSGELPVQISNLQSSYYSFSTNHFYADRKFDFADGINFDGTTSLGSDLSFATDSSFYLHFSTNGDKRFRIITSSAKFNCPDTTNYISAKIKGPYAGFYIASADNCFKSPIAITDTSKEDNGVRIMQWQWNYGDGAKDVFNTTGSVAHKYENPGRYPVTLVVTDQDGCSASSQPDSVMVKGPKAAFTLSANPVSPGSIVTFYNKSNNAGTDSLTNQYTWFYGDGSYSKSGYNENPSHRYSNKGLDTISLIAANAGNTCTDTAVQYLQVKNITLAFTFTTAYVYPETGCPPVIA